MENSEWAEIVDPRPSSLVQSLRAVGYTLPAAVADVVDNSITAGATRIEIDACWGGPDSYIVIRDDGRGMTEPELVEAMRLGTRSPLEVRDPRDLGRFGLGLKTASFSQCRRLTVLSTTEGKVPATRRWDLDIVTESDEWRLLRGPADGSGDRLALNSTAGTAVLWELMDRVVGPSGVADARARDRFLQQIAAIKAHLEVVFHRFLTGRGKVTVSFNANEIEPWDPFFTHHDATQQLPCETLGRGAGAAVVRPFVLPHVSRLTTVEHRRGSGPSGWNAHQGFYIFRNNRLLTAGEWLGLGMQKEEHYKLARIAIELPNTADLDWALDVKKSRARPPEHLRDDLRRIAEATRKRAAEVYRHRGKVLARTAGSVDLLWLRKVTGGKCSYVINREHPLFRAVLTGPAGNPRATKALFRLLEETVPIHTILVDGAERPEAQAAPFEKSPPSDLVETATAVYEALHKGGMRPKEARMRVLVMEPFPQYADIVLAALERIVEGE